MTGTDEHGQKIAEKAEKEGVAPIENCNKYAAIFQKLNGLLGISNDRFIRTTEEKHKKSAQELWRKCAKVGDIYLGQYSGWYDVKVTNRPTQPLFNLRVNNCDFMVLNGTFCGFRRRHL